MQYLILTVLILSISISCKKTNIDGSTVNGTGERSLQFGTSYPLNVNLEEASGIELDESGTFWSFGDKGNQPILYGIDETGNPMSEATLIDANNNDWEDIAIDENNNMVIGNFGNNDNDRDNLKLYWIPNFTEQLSSQPINPKTIKFTYENQTNFPPVDADMHFDAEAIAVWDNFVYIFTKDRSDPFTGITNMYRLVLENEDQEAELIGTFSTSTIKKQGAITGADISPNGKQLALLSEQKIFLFNDITAPDFFNKPAEIFDIPTERKFEGIVFQSENRLFLVNEKKYGADQQIISVDIIN